MTLVPHSNNAVGRIEIHELGGTVGEHALRKHQALGDRKPKVVRLSELLNVLRLPPNAEACPMENMCAFLVESQERTLVFAALKDDCSEWVDKLCASSFQKNNIRVSEPQMEENALYASADDVSDFAVLVQRTDAAARCGLQGAYRLHVGRETLQLRDARSNDTMQEFRYELLRRYGKDKDCLSIETGRRCECGPGTLLFQTSQADTIFSLIQATIRRKTTHAAPPGGLEVDRPSNPNTLTPRAPSPRPRTPELTDITAMFENKLKTQEENLDKPSSSPHPAPITLMPLPSVPKQKTIPKSAMDNIYADPVDCVRAPEVGTSLYVDPASVLPLKPPAHGERSCSKSSVYAEVYDKVTDTMNQEMFTKQKEEPIYSEPMREEKGDRKEEEKEEEEKKPDPFAHLYAQVCKMPKKPRPQDVEWEQDSDVIYENLGII